MMPAVQAAVLLPLERLAGEAQRAAVLGYRPHHVIRRAGRYLGFDLQRHRHIGSHQGNQVTDHFVGDAARIASAVGSRVTVPW